MLYIASYIVLIVYDTYIMLILNQLSRASCQLLAGWLLSSLFGVTRVHMCINELIVELYCTFCVVKFIQYVATLRATYVQHVQFETTECALIMCS